MSNTGATACAACAAGRYNTQMAQSVCVACASGHYSTAVGASASSVCTGCASGKASPGTARSSASTCIACPGQSVTWARGRYADTAGLPACKECPAGKLAGVGGLAACNAQGGGVSLCEAGKYSDGTDCQDCPAGRAKAETSPQDTAATCDACAKGTFQAQTAQAACADCPTGKFNKVVAATTCDAAISAGSTGSVATADQKQAVATTLKLNGFTVETFASAQDAFKTSVASLLAGVEAADVIITDVKDVANRRLRDAAAANRALLGIAGSGVTVMYEVQKPTASAAQSVQTAMAALDISTFVSTLRTTMTAASLTPPPALAAAIVVAPQVAATACGTGFFFATQGTTSTASCAQCPAGKFKPSAGAATAQCLACPVNFAQPQNGQASCTACAAGQVQPLMGKPSCAVPTNGCIAGKFFSGGVCSSCAPGRAQPATSATSCVACATGRYQAASGMATCTQCASGQIAAVAKTACNACPAGTSQAGPNTCSPCPFGTVQPASGKATCDACAASTQAQTISRILCTACSADKICAGGAAAARPKPTPALGQGNSTGGAAKQTLQSRLKKAVKNARERGTELTLYAVFGAVGILTLMFYRVLPQKLLRNLDQYSMAHYVKDGDPLIKRITPLGGAFAVLAICVGTMAGINLASAPNTLVGTSVSPLASDDTPKISFTLSVVALGSSNCSAIMGLQGGAADTTSAVAAASGGVGGCAFSYSCTDCDLLGEETRAFTAPWSFQRIEYTLAVQPGDPAAPLVSLTHVLEAPKDKLLWADGADGDALKRQQRERFAVTPDYFVDDTAEASRCTVEGECLGSQVSDSTTSTGRLSQAIATINTGKTAVGIAAQTQRFEFVFQRSSTKSVITKSNKLTPIQLATLCLNTLLSLLSVSAIAFKKLEPVLTKKLKVKAKGKKGGKETPAPIGKDDIAGALSAIVVRGDEQADDCGGAGDGGDVADGSAPDAELRDQVAQLTGTNEQQNEKIEQQNEKIEQLNETNQQQNEKIAAQQAKLEWLIEEVTSMAAGSHSGDDAAEEIRAATAADGGDDEDKE